MYADAVREDEEFAKPNRKALQASQYVKAKQKMKTEWAKKVPALLPPPLPPSSLPLPLSPPRAT